MSLPILMMILVDCTDSTNKTVSCHLPGEITNLESLSFFTVGYSL